MISSITMKGVASYSNEGVTFNNMNKVNLIFGSNGTGKTTISSFMKEYSGSQETGNPIADRFAQCGVTWEDARRQSKGLGLYCCSRAYQQDSPEAQLQELQAGEPRRLVLPNRTRDQGADVQSRIRYL